MVNNYCKKDLLNLEDRAIMESNSVDMALEQFFNNVLECIVLDEKVLCEEE